MGYREYARHRQVTLRAVQKAIEAGRIKVVVVDGKSKIDSEQADRDWVTNTDPAKQSLLYSAGPDHGDSLLREPQAGLATGAGAARTAVPASSGDDDEPPDEPAAGGATDDDTKAYRAERAQRERIRREREQLELDQLRWWTRPRWHGCASPNSVRCAMPWATWGRASRMQWLPSRTHCAASS